MAIIIHTADPADLLSRIRSAVINKDITTWELDSEGDLTRSSKEWRYLAWFLPSSGSDVLTFGLFGRPGTPSEQSVYAAYHGSFIEMLLLHFSGHFTQAIATDRDLATIDLFQKA